MEWKPIDTAPKDGTLILVYTASGIVECKYEKFPYCEDWAHYWHVNVVESYESIYLVDKPTHWMQLPPPPAD